MIALKTTARTQAFTMRKMGSHLKVLVSDLIQTDLGITMIFFFNTVLKGD